MTPNPTASSPPKSATFIQYDGLPEPIRNALLELETFIGDVDGKDTVIQTDEHTCIDDGTIDADDAVKAFNTIVAALSPSVEPTQGEIDAAAAALGLELGPPDGQSSGWTISHRPNVRWPQDYSEREQTKLRNAATLALEAALTTRPAPMKWAPIDDTTLMERDDRLIERLDTVGEYLCGKTDDDEARKAYATLLYVRSTLNLDLEEYLTSRPAPSAEVAGERNTAKELIAHVIYNDSDLWDLDDEGLQAASDIITKLESVGYTIVATPPAEPSELDKKNMYKPTLPTERNAGASGKFDD